MPLKGREKRFESPKMLIIVKAWFECLCVWQQHENTEPHSVG
jgi:hypothetical protein